MKHLGLKIAGGVVGVSLFGIVYSNIQRRKRDKLASELLRKLTEVIKPVSTGLIEEDAFDVKYLDKVARSVNDSVLMLKPKAAVKYAERIHNAWGAWWQGGDNESEVYSVFRALKDKVQVSQVAKAYQDEYGQNLIDKFNDKFDDDEKEQVLSIVNQLPAYQTKGGVYASI